MNYNPEDNFNFYDELNDMLSNDTSQHADKISTDISMCMISHELLTYNSITLPCKHSFNYIPLYTELCLYNNKRTISCPYCRSITDKLIPYIPLQNVQKIYGVNYPTRYCMSANKCSFIIKKNKLPCNRNGIEYKYGTFCEKHTQYNIDTAWTLKKDQIFKSKSVSELKIMLKSKGLFVGGLKKELINRLCSLC